VPAVQLHDLDADPREMRNVQGAHPEVVQRLEALLREYQQSGRSR
jgi:hypothetical protein